jgi:hypothetical protein
MGSVIGSIGTVTMLASHGMGELRQDLTVLLTLVKLQVPHHRQQHGYITSREDG